MMKITVFGGSGFLGSHVCDKLSDAGHEVTIFDLHESKWLRKDQKMITGDILDETAVRNAIAGADTVFNFAGIADIGAASTLAINTVKYNILGNTIVLESCVQEQIKRYVFASSVYVYSKAGGFYRCSKQASELYIENYHETCGLEYTILRYGSLYGPRSDELNAIYRFVKSALEQKKISYYGSPHALREYIHVEDAALSSVEILEPKYANEHVILTGHRAMRVSDILKMIAEMLGESIEFEYSEDNKSGHYEITPYSFSPRVGKKLSPSYHVDLGQGILRIVEELYNAQNPDFQNINEV